MAGNKFALMGGSIWGNRGAEAMLMTVVAEIRKVDPEAVFNVYTIYPQKDKSLVQDPKIRFLSGEPLSVAFGSFPFCFVGGNLSFIEDRLASTEGCKIVEGI